MKKIIGFIFNADNIFSRIICSLVYIVVYDLAFNGFVFKLFHYMGIDYIPMPATTYMIWAVISIFPILFYKGIKVLSSFFTIFLYIMVYIPFVHAIFTMWGIDTFTKFTYSLLMAFLFSLYFCIGTSNTIFKNIIIAPQIPFKWVEFFTILLTAILVITNIGSMHFVNIFTQSDLMYELRAQNANANFLLTDGVAAAGIFGLLLIGLVFYVLLHILNSISYRYRLSDLLVIFLPTLSYILNTSLFTTLLSNGLLILILFLGCTENPIDIRLNNNKNEQ